MPTVPKATSRKRGQAKTVRAAQKTPLPGDQVTETIDARAETTDNLGSMSLSELRQYAVAQGWSTGTKGTKAELLKLLRANPDGPPKSAKKAQPPADEPKVDPKQVKALCERVTEARKAFGRAKLAEIVGITPSQLWRCEAAQSRPRPDEVPLLVSALERIDSGELVPPEKPKPFGGANQQGGATKAALKSTLDEVQHILSEAPATGAKVAQLRATINNALDVIERATKSDDDN